MKMTTEFLGDLYFKVPRTTTWYQIAVVEIFLRLRTTMVNGEVNWGQSAAHASACASQ